jgi:retron-type reverse transcriptase
VDHDILINLIENKIKDRRFTNLIRKALNAGYFEFKTVKYSITGTPQGGVLSPILANIYLHELDKFVLQLKETFDEGAKARPSPTALRYKRLQATKLGAKKEAQEL